MSSYLLNRKGYYHFRIRIPADLISLIPATELVKSLKTKDRQAARAVSLSYQHSILTTFTLLRAGFITGEQAQGSIDRALGPEG